VRVTVSAVSEDPPSSRRGRTAMSRSRAWLWQYFPQFPWVVRSGLPHTLPGSSSFDHAPRAVELASSCSVEILSGIYSDLCCVVNRVDWFGSLTWSTAARDWTDVSVRFMNNLVESPSLEHEWVVSAH